MEAPSKVLEGGTGVEGGVGVVGGSDWTMPLLHPVSDMKKMLIRTVAATVTIFSTCPFGNETKERRREMGFTESNAYKAN
jgi:hypothetical protein